MLLLCNITPTTPSANDLQIAASTTPSPAVRDAQIARLARLITVRRKLQDTAEPQPHEIAQAAFRFRALIAEAC